MAQASPNETCALEEELMCPICMDLFVDPVTTACGHSFCKECVESNMKVNGLSCPICKRHQSKTPDVNITLRNIVEQIKKAAEEDDDWFTGAPDELACDIYREPKLKAKKSCLLGLASYCSTHLENHSSTGNLTGHTLVEPVKNLDERACLQCMDEGHEEVVSTEDEWRKKKTAASPPSTNVYTSSAAMTTTDKEECKSNFASSQHSTQTATKPKSHHLQHNVYDGVQVNRPVKEHQTPTQPVTVVRPKEHQALSQPADHREMTGNWSINSCTDSATTAARVKEEPRSPLEMPQRSSQRATKPHDLSTVLQVNRPSGERPTTPPPVKKKGREDQLLSQHTEERKVNPELLPKLQLRKEKSDPDSTSTTTQINSAAETTTTEDNKSVCDAAQPDFSTGMKVKELAQMFSAPTTQETAEQAKRKHREEQKPSEVKHVAQKASAATAQERAVQPKEKDREDQKLSQVKRSSRERPTTPPVATAVKPKKKYREDQTLSRASQRKVKPALPPKPQLRKEKVSEVRQVERASESVPDSTSTTTQINSAAETTTTEDNKSVCDAAQPDFSTGMKVKELAQMFLAPTTQETAEQAKRKHREEQKPSEVKHVAQKASAATAQERAVQPKEKDREDQKLSQVKRSSRERPTTPPVATAVKPKKKYREDQTLSRASQRKVKPALPPKPQLRKEKNVPEPTRVTTQMNPASAQATTKEDPKSSCEAAQIPDFSTGLKVKDLTRMFSVTTSQRTAVQPKGKDREEQRQSQVKPISQKLSATTAQDTAVHPKEQDKGDQKRTQVKELARMFSATTTQETAVHPKGKDRQKQKLSQVKELARMFSATTTQQTAVRPKKDKKDQTWS